MRILGLEREQGACNHYRIVQPLYKLLQHKLAHILTIHPLNGADLDFVKEKIMETDLIVMQRPADVKWLNLLKIIQKAGKMIVADYDDNPFETNPMNPAYQYYGTREFKFIWPDGREEMIWENGRDGFNIEANITRLDYFKASFRRSDLVTTTTPVLQSVFKKINPNTIVLPNLIDFDLYPDLECVKKEIRIGWQGGVSHYADLYMVMPAIKQILKKYRNVKFVYLGDARFFGFFKDIPDSQIEVHQWIQNVAYPLKLATLNLDIGICPIVDNPFNRCKSAIKYFEYSALKVPSIASDIAPYTPVISSGVDGILVGPDKWDAAIEELILNRRLRKTMGEKAYSNVYENHNADKKVRLWFDAYEAAVKQDVNEMAGVT